MRLVGRVALLGLIGLGIAWLGARPRRFGALADGAANRGRNPAPDRAGVQPDDFEARLAALDPADAPKAADFTEALEALLAEAAARGETFIEVTSGELHHRVGGYPGANNRMPTCCGVMRGMLKPGDLILDDPAGPGPDLAIRYQVASAA